MKTINYKIKTKLIEELLKDEEFKELDKVGFLGKLALKKKQYAHIYFHSGILDNDSRENIINAKKVVVNSIVAKNSLIKELALDENKIEVIYPAITFEYKKPKEIKEKVCDELGIDSNKKIVFFTAKNFKSSGIVDFLNIFISLNLKDVVAIIHGDKKNIYNLRFKLSKFDYEDKIILLEDYKNQEDLFFASDVFLLPTYNKNFASSVLKAMFCKCAVFVPVSNAAKELVDVFSTMESPSDRSMQFKLAALLQNEDDLKLIKKQNRLIAKEYTMENQLAKLKNSL